MIHLTVSYIVRAAIVCVGITSAIITCIVIVLPIMSTAITAIMVGTAKVIMIMVYICDINTEVPIVSTRIDRAIEILCPQKAAVLRVAHYVAQIIVSYVEGLIIIIQCPFISANHIIHNIAYRIDEIVIDLIRIIVLIGVHIQLISHLIR